MTQSSNRRAARSALTIAGTYAILASAWVLVSDLAMSSWSHSSPRFVMASVTKGLGFVTVTSLALYFLARAHLRHIHELVQHDEQLERMRRLGEVAAGITHDFNNILVACRAFTEVLRRTSSDARTLAPIQHIETVLRRGEALTSEILTYAQPQRLLPVSVPLAQFLSEFTDELRTTMPMLCIRQSVTPSDLTVSADPDQLHRVLMNLAVNARDAMPNGGTLTFAARVPASIPDHIDGARAADFIEMTVLDTGKGIDPENLPHIFEPQFTTKRTGTGLGLAIVHRIVSDHNGYVSVSSRPGEGTKITILLPRA